MRVLMVMVLTIAAAGPAAAGPAEKPALGGCYSHTYDRAHLAKHKGQMVTRATVGIEAPPADWPAADGKLPAAMADLRLWARGYKKPFVSHGVCWAEGEGLHCGGSLSAADADTCKSRRDGVRDCRIDFNDAGSFAIRAEGDGVLVTIVERLELVPSPFDGGPFLSLSPGNAENHAFQLGKSSCK